MSSSSTTTDTPAPISPFSSLHSLSEATSDELPDLGAFRTVFRALSDLHPPPILTRRHIPSTITTSTTPTQSSSAFTHPRSTVWAHNNIASYLQSQTEDNDSVLQRPRSSSSLPESHTTPGSDETERRIEIEEIDSFNEEEEDEVQVSLGYLNETLSFIAAERERLTALRGSSSAPKLSSGANTSTSESEPGRKRRRKRNKPSRNEEDTEVSAIDADDSCSSSDPTKTSSATPRVSKVRLKRTRSTPSLRDMPPNLSSSSSTSVDPRISRLRSLASKLRVHFRSEASFLRRVLRRDQPDEDDFVDPRGPAPTADTPLIHIFIDHSNILIGLLTYIKRHPRLVPSPRRAKQLSHAALSLILERGRPISRRVLATSSPLYQPMDDAVRLGYEVRVYARVPRDDSSPSEILIRPGSSESPKKAKTHTRNISSSSNTESSDPPKYVRRSSQQQQQQYSASQPSTPNGRVRYREQGVDELLQLKIHDALAQSDGRPPPGSTIVLATGDGNAGQFSDDGFLGPIRVALRKGWAVELVAWEDGLSRAWKREFENEPGFRIIGMERFASDLIQV